MNDVISRCIVISMLMFRCHGYEWNSMNLPTNHIPLFFTNNADIENLCQQDKDCPYKDYVDKNACWGYEKNCPLENWRIRPHCPDDSEGAADSKNDQIQKFWTSADFGSVAWRQSEIATLCVPGHEDDSKLECSTKTRFCRAKHLYLDLRGEKFSDHEMYHEHFLQDGEIGGHCKLDRTFLTQQLKGKSIENGNLQSWIHQLKSYTSLSFLPSKGGLYCDTVVMKPTIFMKYSYMSLYNMFHHFSDFINLYTSQHVNNFFSTDVQIIIWDESQNVYVEDMFKETFGAFTKHPVMFLKELRGQTVCFKDVMFAMPPRMLNGTIVNMSLISGCYGSSLITAFSEHILHRLNIHKVAPSDNNVRVTFLSRNTPYRNIINKYELFAALGDMNGVDATFAEFEIEKMSFLDQLMISRNSDIFIGIHGAGLTHVLFQPDWGVVIELHNCSSSCYNNIARLRGLKYLTFERRENYRQVIKCKENASDYDVRCEDGNLERQSDFSFDKQTFVNLINQAVSYVRNHPEYIQAQNQQQKDEL